MPTRKPPLPDDPEQYRRFLETAKEVEADESPDAMDRVFDKLKPTLKGERNPKPRASKKRGA